MFYHLVSKFHMYIGLFVSKKSGVYSAKNDRPPVLNCSPTCIVEIVHSKYLSEKSMLIAVTCISCSSEPCFVQIQCQECLRRKDETILCNFHIQPCCCFYQPDSVVCMCKITISYHKVITQKLINKENE